MGKDLKGKELGVGLSQRKDGRYSARYTNVYGKRIEKCSWKLQELKVWLKEAKYLEEHGGLYCNDKMTLDVWFEQWSEVIIKPPRIKKTTWNGYVNYYRRYIQQELGYMSIGNIKPLHCQKLLNSMIEKGYSNCVLLIVKVILNSLFETAIENHLIRENPITKSVKKMISDKTTKERRALTKEEQVLFLEACRKYSYHDFYVIALQTGMRASELIGLTWDCVDFANRVIRVEKSLVFDSIDKKWYFSTPKNGKSRIVPMTKQAYDKLVEIKNYNTFKKVTRFEYKDLVFRNRNGMPNHVRSYDAHMTKICNKIGLEKVSLHNLRHTFATRCVEAGIKPKTLQIILGHSKIQTTMNIYVHVIEDEKFEEIQKLEQLYDAM